LNLLFLHLTLLLYLTSFTSVQTYRTSHHVSPSTVQTTADNFTSLSDASPLKTAALLDGEIFGTGETFGAVVMMSVTTGVVAHVVVSTGANVGVVSHVDISSSVVQSSVSLLLSQSDVVEIGPHGSVTT